MNKDMLQVDARDAAQLAEAFGRAPEMVLGEVRLFMTLVTTHLKAEVQERTPTGAHQLLRQSIGNEVRLQPNTVLGVVGSPLNYAEAVELGTKPHWAPIAPLEEWARLKLGLVGVKAEQAAQRIQYAIAHRGTLGVGMFHRAYAANLAEISRQFGLTAQRIADRLGEA